MATTNANTSRPIIRLGIFGIGLHFQETYTTALKRPAISSLISLEWVTDLESRKTIALERCKNAGQTPKFVGVQSFKGQSLSSKLEKKLDDLIAKNPVDAVLISTTPEQHRAYAEWALRHKIDVLLDKPITSRDQAAFNEREALGILEDWQALNKAAHATDTLLMINAHRRFHPAYREIGRLLKSVADSYGFGVSSISSFNSDGQWRMPNELVDITYHGYNTGNGVISHFGYHYLDLAASWYKKGTPAADRASSARISSSFSTAANYARQISATHAAPLLMANGQPMPEVDNEETLRTLRNYGEVDAFGSIELCDDDALKAHISLQMVHSGFSQRAWTKPATNLYKENGRVRWENHLIQQGPLHAIEVRTFQAVQPNHTDPEAGLPRWTLGGSDQLEINIFRNKLIGGKPLETITVTDLLDEIPEKDVIHEDTKARVLQLFIGVVANRKEMLDALSADQEWKEYVKAMAKGDAHDLSLITTHQPPVAFMAGMYASAARRFERPSINERIEVPLQW